LSSAIKENPCGLRAFSVQQVVFVIFHIVYLLFLVWISVSGHHQSNPNPDALGDQPIVLQNLPEGQDPVITNPETVPDMMVPVAKPVNCKWKAYAPVILLGCSIFTTFIDLVTAILAWKGYKQLMASRTAVQTFTDLSETPDNEMMMTPTNPHNVVPLNVVYVPANLYDPLQTYQ